MSALAAIPLPLRIIGLVVIGVVAFKLLGALGSFAIWLAVGAWSIVLFGLLYAHGWLNAFARVPILAGALGLLTNSHAAAAPARSLSAAEPVRRALSREERRGLYERAQQTLDGLVGVETAVDAVRRRLVEVAEDDPANPFQTTAPAAIVLVSGPRAVGKTTLAHTIVELYAGIGALERADVETLRETDLRSGRFGSATDLGRAKAEAAVGGALLLDDADWLVRPDPLAGGDGPGVDLGLAILEVARQHPRKFVVLATLSEDAQRRLRADAGHARWLDKLAVRPVAVEALGEVALFAILAEHLAAAGWAPDGDAAAKAATKLVTTLRDDFKRERFAAVDDCRRLAEWLNEKARHPLDEFAHESALQNGRLSARFLRKMTDFLDELE